MTLALLNVNAALQVAVDRAAVNSHRGRASLVARVCNEDAVLPIAIDCGIRDVCRARPVDVDAAVLVCRHPAVAHGERSAVDQDAVVGLITRDVEVLDSHVRRAVCVKAVDKDARVGAVPVDGRPARAGGAGTDQRHRLADAHALVVRAASRSRSCRRRWLDQPRTGSSGRAGLGRCSRCRCRCRSARRSGSTRPLRPDRLLPHRHRRAGQTGRRRQGQSAPSRAS